MKRSTKILGAAAIAVLAALVLWYPLIEPAVVRFPKSTRVVTHYSGTLTTYMDNATGGKLATPSAIPVTIDRTVESVPDQTSASKAVVRETNVIHAGGLDQWQSHVFVLDRRTMENVKDPRNQAFGEPVNWAGSYRLTMPLGTKHSSQYAIAEPETGSTAVMRGAAGPETTNVHGLKVLRMTSSLSPTPVGPQYTKVMVPFMGFPTSLTFGQVQAQLQAAGVDTAGLTTALASTLTPAELTTLLATLQTPVPLRYYYVNSGEGYVEPDTGMIVGLPNVNEGISVSPDLSVWAPAVDILSRYSSSPAIQSVTQTIAKFTTAPPQPVYQIQYQETAASMASRADSVAAQRTQLRLARYYLPAGLAVVFWVLGGLTVYTWRRPRPTAPGEVVPIPAPAAPAARAA